jgi:uncharacterized membrane protein YphA (DoxX/SURF4 family)
VPALGIAIPWTVYVLTLHAVWSISVPIALVEEGTGRRTEPWLRAPGLVVVAALALVGAAGTFAVSYLDGHFLAVPGQLVACVVVAAGLVVLAFRLPRREPVAAVAGEGGRLSVPQVHRLEGVAPGGVHSSGPPRAARWWAAAPPWLVAVVTLAAGALFVLGGRLPAVAAVVLLVVVLTGIAFLLTHWAAGAGWDGRHRLAAAGGALLTYAWHGFAMQPVVDASPRMIVISHVAFAAGAVVLLIVLGRRASRAAEPVVSRDADPGDRAVVTERRRRGRGRAVWRVR